MFGVYIIVHNILYLYAYKFQLLHEIKDTQQNKRLEFAVITFYKKCIKCNNFKLFNFLFLKVYYILLYVGPYS